MPIEPLPSTSPADEALEHERLTSLINSMADGVIATDEKAIIVLYNGAALNTLDLNSSMQNKDVASVMTLVDKEDNPIDVRQLVLSAKTQTSSRDYRLRYSDGSTINLYLSIAPVHLGFGQNGQRGFVLLMRDITREKSLEEERDEFISVASHELRTPIAIAEGNISNALFIARKAGVSQQIMDTLQQAHDQINFLSELVNDLSTLSRAERGKLPIDIVSINAHALIEELAKNYTPEANKKGLELQIDLDPSLEILISSELYVREILQNFITNAIKYTEHGSVTLGAHQKLNGILFYVQDTGIGIGRGDMERVFEKFFRSEDFRTRKSSGTGLGLYVTMKLAHLIQAQISLKSELNKGSLFSIFIPNLEKPRPKNTIPTP